MFAELKAFQELTRFDSQFIEGVKGAAPCQIINKVSAMHCDYSNVAISTPIVWQHCSRAQLATVWTTTPIGGLDCI